MAKKPSLAERIKQGLQEAIEHERGDRVLRTSGPVRPTPPGTCDQKKS
jgi:hypothetical protein